MLRIFPYGFFHHFYRLSIFGTFPKSYIIAVKWSIIYINQKLCIFNCCLLKIYYHYTIPSNEKSRFVSINWVVICSPPYPFPEVHNSPRYVDLPVRLSDKEEQPSQQNVQEEIYRQIPICRWPFNSKYIFRDSLLTDIPTNWNLSIYSFLNILLRQWYW